MKVWSEEEQDYVEVEDPPEGLCLRDIYGEVKLTQRYSMQWKKVKGKVDRNAVGLAALWALMLALVSALLLL